MICLPINQGASARICSRDECPDSDGNGGVVVAFQRLFAILFLCQEKIHEPIMRQIIASVKRPRERK